MNLKARISERLNRLYQRIDRGIRRFPRSYLLAVSLFASLGYSFVLLFPILTLVSLDKLYQHLLVAESFELVPVLSWLVVFLFSVQASYRIYKTRPVAAVGITMPESKIPGIYKLVNRLQTHFRRPVIHKVIITADYELDIVKTPRWMLPVWSSNTLVIGFPVLLCLSPQQFELMLARRIGQFSKQHNKVTNWIYQLRGVWQQFGYVYGKQPYLESKLLSLFYRVYGYLYKYVSAHAARMDELYADNYAMELYNHEDVRGLISADAVYRWYLDHKFWPAVMSLANNKPSVAPFRNLVAAIRSGIRKEHLTKLNRLILNQTTPRSSRIPSPVERLKNIGHDTPAMKINTGKNAAEYYMEKSLNGAYNLMDKFWAKKNRKQLDKKQKSTKRSIFKRFALHGQHS